MEQEQQQAEDFMQPVALIVDELRSEETANRVEAMKKISTIAVALGHERTRTEFIPFIESTVLCVCVRTVSLFHFQSD